MSEEKMKFIEKNESVIKMMFDMGADMASVGSKSVTKSEYDQYLNQ